MNSHYKISFVCAWYNRASYVKTTIESMINQTVSDYEIIIIDDGSTDQETIKNLSLFNEKITLLRQPNSGFTAAIAKAIEIASGEYIAIQGAGEISQPDRLLIQSNFLDKNLDYVGVGCASTNIFLDADSNECRRIDRTFSGDIKHNLFMKKNPVIHGSMMFRKSIYEKCGGYRKQFLYSQDLDLWLRLTLHGNIFILPQQLYIRNIFLSDGIASSPEKLILQQRLALAARTFSKTRKHLGYDEIDYFGDNAMLLIQSSKQAGIVAAKSALKSLFLEKLETSNFLIHLALMEKKSFSTIFIIMNIKLAKKFKRYAYFLKKFLLSVGKI